MKALLLNVPREAADRFFSGETKHLPCSQIPDMAHVLRPAVNICVDGGVIGGGVFGGVVVSREPVDNGKRDHYGYNVAWVVVNATMYAEPLPLKRFKLKRPPEEWRWVKL